MRRAIVISILVHLLMAASLMEPLALPTGALRQANGGLPLSVSFKLTSELDNKDTALRGTAMLPIAERPKSAVSPAVAKRKGKVLARQERGEAGVPVPSEADENLAFLAADLEREYRLDLARAARRSPDYPAALAAQGQRGIVRMSISYWSRQGAPSVALEQSSGHWELDQQALKTLALAIGMVPVPPGAQGTNFRMHYALEYRGISRD
ncbi:hypothetical protein LZ012_17570 [Dechloromonas sp. XY25]|uniref:TonB C-terminal domain-containing protein n=1 Tax=Dechloromonas hankyongensis TaxID=2908002 RepID=A0ABS9K6V8_9RHOO|nr:hypothetical protein [Dechloromonas hankyongensis]MCG2578810.1 hypothetical protein [Dechloromonas hankyongensis]